MPDLTVTKEGAFLYVARPDGARIRFNLKENRMEAPPNKRHADWHAVETQYKFFSGFSHYDLKFSEDKFRKLKEYVGRSYDIESPSSYIARLANVMHLEAFITEGINIEFRRESDYYGRGIGFKAPKRNLNEYDKNVIKFFKRTGTKLTVDFERFYFYLDELIWKEANPHRYTVPDEAKDKGRGRDMAQRMLHALETLGLDTDTTNAVLQAVTDREGIGCIALGYDPADLVRYIGIDTMNEGLRPDDAVQYLLDWFKMNRDMNVSNFKKYPKYLHSMHDIAMYNRNRYREQYDEIAFAKSIRYDLEWSYKDFVVLSAHKAQDLKDEGNALSHCVGGYVKSVIEGKKLIIFLRKADTPTESLVTLEVIGSELTQARGYANRSLNKEEQRVLRKWCKAKNLTAGYGLLGNALDTDENDDYNPQQEELQVVQA